MIVCDECMDVTKKADECSIILEKTDRLPALMSKRVTKPKPREVVKIPLVLCDQCLSRVMSNLGSLKVRHELGGVKEVRDGRP